MIVVGITIGVENEATLHKIEMVIDQIASVAFVPIFMQDREIGCCVIEQIDNQLIQPYLLAYRPQYSESRISAQIGTIPAETAWVLHDHEHSIGMGQFLLNAPVSVSPLALPRDLPAIDRMPEDFAA